EDAILRLEKRTIEARVGELQRLLAEADERNDHGERKRVLAEQGALVDALQAFDSPQARAMMATALPKHASGSPGSPPPFRALGPPPEPGEAGDVGDAGEAGPTTASDTGPPPDDDEAGVPPHPGPTAAPGPAAPLEPSHV